jgi:hypothetical protein
VALSKEEELMARIICEHRYGVICPDPGMHVRLPDGRVGPHAWVMQAIKDAKSATE